jgi:outer membrane immunogenic protein
MRRFLLAAVMFGAATGAQAADMPDLPFLRGSFTDGLSATSRNWDGFYVGGQVGYGSANMDFSKSLVGLTNFIYRNSVLETPTSQLAALGKAAPHTSGFGGFAGYNWQWEELVYGVEANYSHFNNFRGSSSATIGPIEYAFPAGQFTPANDAPDFSVTISGNATAQIEDAVTFRGRVGWAAGNFLPYVFGGAAVGLIDVQRSVTAITTRTDTITNNNITTTVGPNLVPGNSGSQSQARTNYVPGWTGGLGVEYAVWGGLFVRGEWEYTKFLSIMNTSLSMNNVRAAIGYKF